ncbi:unnamed protein product [Clavelina lepadiformis]|uniref:Uncharacterized protein n=1 Tax=Clavelina lepadiformis TaxID=159417 RepID=A0ABP0G4V1_CLALP
MLLSEMTFPTLIDLCGYFVASECPLSSIIHILSTLQLPEGTLHAISRHLSMDKIIKIENICGIFFHCFWKNLVEKCAEANNAFRAKLHLTFDPFEWKLGFREESDLDLAEHKRQVLLNCLFQESLDRMYHSHKKAQGLPVYPLHEATAGNSPSLNDLGWLLLLSCEINCFHFYPRHATFLAENNDLLDNISGHVEHLQLRLNFTLNVNIPLYKNYYMIVHSVMCGGKVWTVMINDVHIIEKSVEILELCCGKVKQYEETIPDFVSDDIWDYALAGNPCPAVSEPSGDVYDCYDHFISDESLDQVCVERNARHKLQQCLGAKQLVLEFDILGFSQPLFENCFSVLQNAKILSKLAINLWPVGPTTFVNCTECIRIITFAIKTLLLAPHSKLESLHLSNFVLNQVDLCDFHNDLYTFVALKFSPFREVCFYNCKFVESNRTNDMIVNNVFPALVKGVVIEGGTFSGNSVFTYFKQFVRCLNFNSVCLTGSCILEPDGSIVNIPMLCHVLSKKSKVCPLKVAFSIPSECILSINQVKNLTDVFIKNQVHQLVIQQTADNPIHPDLIDSFEQCAENVVVKTILSSTDKRSNTLADYISQM